MKKWKKRILMALAAVAVLVVVGLVVLIANLGKAVEAAVETGGTMVLDVPVELENASVSLTGGSAGLDGFTMGSPEGYDAEHMFVLGHAHVDVGIGSLMSDEILVEEVVIDGPEITVEWAKGKTNWTALLEKLEKEEAAEEEEPAEETEEEKGEGKKTRIGLMSFKNGKIKVKTALATLSVPLPPLELRDIGGDDGGGVTAQKLITQIIRGLEKSVVETAKSALDPEQLKGLATGAAGAVGDAGKGAAGAVGDVGSGAGEAVGGAVTGAGKKLGGLLGGGKDDEDDEDKTKDDE